MPASRRFGSQKRCARAWLLPRWRARTPASFSSARSTIWPEVSGTDFTPSASRIIPTCRARALPERWILGWNRPRRKPVCHACDQPARRGRSAAQHSSLLLTLATACSDGFRFPAAIGQTWLPALRREIERDMKRFPETRAFEAGSVERTLSAQARIMMWRLVQTIERHEGGYTSTPGSLSGP